MNLREIITMPTGKLHYCDDCRHAFDRYSTFAQPAEWYGSCPLCGSAGRQIRSNHELIKRKCSGSVNCDARRSCNHKHNAGSCRQG